MFLDRVYFSPTCFFRGHFFSCQAFGSIMFACVRHTLGSSPNWPPSAPGPFSSPDPGASFLPVPVHVSGPVSGRMWWVLAAAVAVVCPGRPGTGRVLGGPPGAPRVSAHRASLLQLVVMARPCVSSLFNSRPSSVILSGSVTTVPFPIGSNAPFSLDLAAFAAKGERMAGGAEPCGEGQATWVLCLNGHSRVLRDAGKPLNLPTCSSLRGVGRCQCTFFTWDLSSS